VDRRKDPGSRGSKARQVPSGPTRFTTGGPPSPGPAGYTRPARGPRAEPRSRYTGHETKGSLSCARTPSLKATNFGPLTRAGEGGGNLGRLTCSVVRGAFLSSARRACFMLLRRALLQQLLAQVRDQEAAAGPCILLGEGKRSTAGVEEPSVQRRITFEALALHQASSACQDWGGRWLRCLTTQIAGHIVTRHLARGTSHLLPSEAVALWRPAFGVGAVPCLVAAAS